MRRQREVLMFNGKRPAQNYLIFYQHNANGMTVLTIVHGMRDWELLLEGRGF